MRALALAFLLSIALAAPTPLSAVQETPEQDRQQGENEEPASDAAEPAEPGEQAEPSEGDSGEEEQSGRGRRPGLLPLFLVAETELGSRTVGPALLHEGALLVATTGGEVASLDATTLETRWKLGMPNAELLPPCLLPNGLLVASRSGSLVLVETESGEIVKEAPLNTSLAAAPTCKGGSLFVASDRHVMAYDVESWQENWRTPLQDPPLALSAGGELLLVSDRLGGLHALDSMTGELRWQFQGRGRFEAPAAFDAEGRRLYLGDTAGYFYALSVQEGEVHYRWATGAAVTTPILLEEDRLFVVSYANTLFCYRTGNGHELWRANLPGRPAAAPFRVRRRVVVLTLNGRVVEYAAGGQPAPRVYAAPDDILPYPTWLPDVPGMALPLRSGRLLLLHTGRAPGSETDQPEEVPEEDEDPGADPAEQGLDEPTSPSATRGQDTTVHQNGRLPSS